MGFLCGTVRTDIVTGQWLTVLLAGHVNKSINESTQRVLLNKNERRGEEPGAEAEVVAEAAEGKQEMLLPLPLLLPTWRLLTHAE